MFPSTRWTAIQQAALLEPDALEAFAQVYRGPVLRYIRGRGFLDPDAEDLCQDAFMRLLKGKVLAKADAGRGRFRALLLTVVRRTIQDRLRKKRREQSLGEHDPADRDPDFDRLWVLHLAERAMQRLRDQGSPYYEVLREHLAGQPQDRNKLWIARKKLIALIRAEVLTTCSSHEEFEGEVAYLSGFLRPG